MKRILVFGITDFPGGIESVIMNYYRNIDKNKIQFDFLCNTENNFFKNYYNKYDAIWVNVCSLANIDYLKIAKKYNIKTRIIHCHTSQNMDSKLRGILHKFNKLFLKKYATDFWSCSASSSSWFYSKSIMNSNKFKIIKNAIDLDKFIFNNKIREEYRRDMKIDDDTIVIRTCWSI